MRSLIHAAHSVPVSYGKYLDEEPDDTYIVHMDDLLFVWDDKKDRANIKKHGISFEEAQTTFYDENATVYYDPDHSEEDDRFILLGMNSRLHTLVVCHCYRESESIIRIISARKADKVERSAYGRRQR
jgi:uncharacterized DUF497 family protein